MPIPDENFNVAKFLYYNPELTASSNIVNNTQAYEWAHSNDTADMVWNDDSILATFNSEAFLLDYKRNVNASGLNRTIQNAMLAEGFTQSALNQRAKYMATIYQDALLESTNVFRFNHFPVAPEDKFYVTMSNLGVGDHVKLMNTTTKVFEYAIVAEIVDNERIRLSNARKTYDGIGDIYRIVGIRLYDYVRLAKINYLRGLDPAPDVPNPDALGFVDPAFNPELYRLLYPDAGELSDIKAYYDYINRRDNNEKRIGRVTDFSVDSNVIDPDFDYVNINYRLTIAPTGGLRWGDRYVYGISDDNVTRASLLNQSQDQLITEYAIKKYIDRSYEELATFNDMIVNGDAQFNGLVDITGPLQVKDLYVDGIFHARSDATVFGNLTVAGVTSLHGGTHIYGYQASNSVQNVDITDATHMGTSHFKTDVFMDSNLYVAGYSLGPRIGIGPAVPVDYTATPTGLYDATLKNANVRQVLDVGADLPVGEIALKVNGFVQADNIAYVSDARLKNVHGLISGKTALAAIEALAPISFTYKDESSASGGGGVEKLGFLADDVERVVPEAVSKIARYEITVSLGARIASETMLVLEGDEVLELRTGDEVKIEGQGWATVASCVGQTVVLSSYVEAVHIGSVVKIIKLKMKDVKSIDYPNLVAVMWSALRELVQRSH